MRLLSHTHTQAESMLLLLACDRPLRKPPHITNGTLKQPNYQSSLIPISCQRIVLPQIVYILYVPQRSQLPTLYVLRYLLATNHKLVTETEPALCQQSNLAYQTNLGQRKGPLYTYQILNYIHMSNSINYSLHSTM